MCSLNGNKRDKNTNLESAKDILFFPCDRVLNEETEGMFIRKCTWQISFMNIIG